MSINIPLSALDKIISIASEFANADDGSAVRLQAGLELVALKLKEVKESYENEEMNRVKVKMEEPTGSSRNEEDSEKESQKSATSSINSEEYKKLELTKIQLEAKVEELQKIIKETIALGIDEAGARMKKDALEEAEKKLQAMRDISCCICLSPFGGKIIPRTGSCGHSVCKSCLPKVSNKSCPTCRQDRAFKSATKNFLAKDLLAAANVDMDTDDEDLSPPGTKKRRIDDSVEEQMNIFRSVVERRRARSPIIPRHLANRREEVQSIFRDALGNPGIFQGPLGERRPSDDREPFPRPPNPHLSRPSDIIFGQPPAGSRSPDFLNARDLPGPSGRQEERPRTPFIDLFERSQETLSPSWFMNTGRETETGYFPTPGFLAIRNTSSVENHSTRWRDRFNFNTPQNTSINPPRPSISSTPGPSNSESNSQPQTTQNE